MRSAACLLVACTACGRVGFDARSDGGADSGVTDGATDDAPRSLHCATWSLPVGVPSLSSGSLDFETALSSTGVMAFTSARRANFTGGAIFTALPDGSGGWQDVSFRDEINLPQGTKGPAWNGDATRLYFTQFASGGVGRAYQADWNGTKFGAPQMITELPPDIVSVAVTPDELELFWSGQEDISLFHATRASVTDAWVMRGKLPLAIDGTNGWPSITADGLVLYWEHGMTSAAGAYRSTRPSRASAWTTPEHLANLDLGGAPAGDPEVTPDGTRLFLSRGTPDSDIYVANCE